MTLPNTLGMVMYADGGVVGSKPCAASGRHIDRMSDYCNGFRYDPAHRDLLRRVPRMGFARKNLIRLSAEELHEIRNRAELLRREWGMVS